MSKPVNVSGSSKPEGKNDQPVKKPASSKKKVAKQAAAFLLLFATMFFINDYLGAVGVACAALVLPGAGGQFIGSIAGMTFQRGRYGAIVRNKTSPVQPNTDAQMEFRNRVATASTAWKTLTNAERAQWAALAAAYPTTNRFGQEVFLTAQAFFNMAAMNLLNAGENILTTPVGVDDWIVPAAELALSFSENTGFTVFSLSDPSGVGDVGFVQMTRPLPSTVNFGSLGREWRTIAFGDASSLVSGAVNPAYNAKFGIPLSNSDSFPVGNTVYVRVKMIASDTGASSPFLVGSTNIISGI